MSVCRIGTGGKGGEQLEEPICDIASGGESGWVILCTQV